MKTKSVSLIIFWLLIFFLNSGANAGTTVTLDADRLYDYAVKSYKGGDFSESASAFHSFLSFFSEDKRAGDALVLRGFCLFALKRYPEASSAFKKAFDSPSYGEKIRNTSGLMIASCFEASGDRPSAMAFMENWASSVSADDKFKERIKYETAWLYLSNDDRQTAEKRFSEIRSSYDFKIPELQDELKKVPSFEKNPTLAGCLAVIPGGGFAYLGRYSDAFAALVVDTTLGLAAWQSFDKDIPALGGIISFVGVGFYLGGVYGSVSAAQKMNRKNRTLFYESLKTRLYVKDNGIGAGFSVDF